MDTLAYYMAHTPAIMRAMNERQSALVTLKTLEADLARKRQNLADVEQQGVDDKNTAKVNMDRRMCCGRPGVAVGLVFCSADVFTCRSFVCGVWMLRWRIMKHVDGKVVAHRTGLWAAT